jgi:hypothetical protein
MSESKTAETTKTTKSKEPLQKAKQNDKKWSIIVDHSCLYESKSYLNWVGVSIFSPKSTLRLRLSLEGVLMGDFYKVVLFTNVLWITG